MRNFGTDKKKDVQFTLGDDPTIYAVPLLPYVPLVHINAISKANLIEDEDARAVARIDAVIDMLRLYLGDKVDTLTADNVTEIFDALNEASEQEGAGLGE